MPGLLPKGTVVARKTGTIDYHAADVGIITLPQNLGHVILTIYIKQSKYTGSPLNRIVAEISRTVYDYFIISNEWVLRQRNTNARDKKCEDLLVKIYVGHSSSYDYVNELYQPLKASKLWDDHILILPHDDKSETIPSKGIIAKLFRIKSTCNIDW